MIENIKWFGNKLHTLIIGIIVVLVVLFFYQLIFVIRDNNYIVKGGESGAALIKFPDFGPQYVLGMEIQDERSGYKYPFYVLNEEGIKTVKEFKYLDFIVFNTIKDEITMMFGNSYNYILDENKKGRVIQRVFEGCSNGEISREVNSPNPTQVIDLANTKTDFATFDFFWCLCDDSECQAFTLYCDLVSFLEENVSELIERVDFIGQPTMVNIQSPSKFYSEKTSVKKSDKIPRKFEVSPKSSSKDIDENNCLDFYKKCKENVRNWYSDSNGMKEIIINNFKVQNGRIIKKRSKGKGEDFEVADIYPAHKTILFVLLLIILFPLYDGDDTRYKKMIASYILYANLFNSVCASKMESDWNTLVGNLYVYRCLNENGQKTNKLDEEMINKLKEAEQKMLSKKLESLQLSDYSSFVGELSHDARGIVEEDISSRNIDSQEEYEGKYTDKIFIYILYRKDQEPIDDGVNFLNFQKIASCNINIRRKNNRKKGGKKLPMEFIRGSIFFWDDSIEVKSNVSLLRLVKDETFMSIYGNDMEPVFNSHKIIQLMFHCNETLNSFLKSANETIRNPDSYLDFDNVFSDDDEEHGAAFLERDDSYEWDFKYKYKYRMKLNSLIDESIFSYYSFLSNETNDKNEYNDDKNKHKIDDDDDDDDNNSEPVRTFPSPTPASQPRNTMKKGIGKVSSKLIRAINNRKNNP